MCACRGPPAWIGAQSAAPVQTWSPGCLPSLPAQPGCPHGFGPLRSWSCSALRRPRTAGLGSATRSWTRSGSWASSEDRTVRTGSPSGALEMAPGELRGRRSQGSVHGLADLRLHGAVRQSVAAREEGQLARAADGHLLGLFPKSQHPALVPQDIYCSFLPDELRWACGLPASPRCARSTSSMPFPRRCRVALHAAEPCAFEGHGLQIRIQQVFSPSPGRQAWGCCRIAFGRTKA
mmetsp:Transcript_49282/g.157648  ORF Transcript_49282/g.157648 Transcript_49282/m.157648 type:complete len:235 (-) Transcript_49282:155-859(-)